MQAIRLLDTKTINKIAAGEVVEAPRSVVKELAENAIDAGATAVTIEIREGGISYIRVTDNGSGIEREQVTTAFLRHATSKMSQIEDLEHIFTLGFRGEALASIAGVAQVEMTTKTRTEEIGTEIEISGGEVKGVRDVSCTDGTTVIVKNLFYNVPARRKFLKKPAAESGHVSDLINKLALGHPEVSFKYINNDTTMLHTAGNGDLKTAVFYVYGKETAENLLPIDYKRGNSRVYGMIGRPELSRGNRNYENLFINGRFIKNATVSAAVEDGYKTRLMIGKFPVFVLNLEIDPQEVDVNVHPAKLEVRFKNDDEVYELFYQAIIKAFDKEVLIPKVTWDKPPAQKQGIPKGVQQGLEDMPPKGAESIEPIKGEEEKTHDSKTVKTDVPPVFYPPTEDRTVPKGTVKSIDQLLKKKGNDRLGVQQQAEPFVVDRATDGEAERNSFFKQYKIIGQIFRTYWLVEQGESVFLIDQHAAHERILFEEFMTAFKAERVISQKLLSPLMLRLSPMETEVLKDNKELLEGFGFEIETFSETEYALKAVPYLIKEPSSIGFFTEILDSLGEQRVRSVYDIKLLTVATMACKAAVKGHDRLSFQEAEAMIERLLKLENPFSCPHGRPTIIEMPRYELEKKFKRIQD